MVDAGALTPRPALLLGKQAYRRFVRVKVERQMNEELGPEHLDTAFGNHNLACSLERLGKVDKAIELFSAAFQVVSRELPRTSPVVSIVSRNLAKAQRKEQALQRRAMEELATLEQMRREAGPMHRHSRSQLA